MEIMTTVKLVGAEILEDGALTGFVIGQPMDDMRMCAEDVAVRLGQLLCRWAVSQTPAFGLKVGVHTGSLKSLVAPTSGKCCYFGDAITESKRLADISAQDSMVHMSVATREKLRGLDKLRLTCSQNRDTYYLDPATHVNVFEEEAAKRGNNRRYSFDHTAGMLPIGNDAPAVTIVRGLNSMTLSTPGLIPHCDKLGFDDFKKLLTDHKVQIDKFGKGDAKTLRELYRGVVELQDSYLLVKGERLERVKDLVRISLRIRGNDNRLRELRIAAQIRSDGGIRKRDQKLAMVLRVPEGHTWKDAVEACFEEKFKMSKKDQAACFTIDTESYTFKEECMVSRTFPDIMTTYKSHDVVVNIKNKSRQELLGLGLPEGTDFSTDTGTGEHFWTWAPLGNSNEDKLATVLQENGIEATEFSPSAFADLYDEVYESCNATLDIIEGELCRTIRIIKVWLVAQVLSLEHVLVSKAKFQKGKSDDKSTNRPLSMRMSKDQDWEEAVEVGIFQRLGIAADVQSQFFTIDPRSYTLTEEVAFSRSYPGLRTIYLVNECNCIVVSTTSPKLQSIGLPDGSAFAFSRMEAAKGPGENDVVITHWCWKPVKEMEREAKEWEKPAMTDSPCKKAPADDMPLKRRLPIPAKPKESTTKSGKDFRLVRLTSGMTTDWKSAKRAAANIRDPAYTCKMFYEDVTAAFPELALYVACEESGTASGRTPDDEYQRTMGAMFAVFWLMRLHLDGSQSFCFGVDENFNARTGPPEDASSKGIEEFKRREVFRNQTDWSKLEGLVINAGLLPRAMGRSTSIKSSSSRSPTSTASSSRSPIGAVGKQKSAMVHDSDRTLAMLVLTAIHDIMKIKALLPCVDSDKCPEGWSGYKVGEVIQDHDCALNYVLEFFPEALPSFAGLAKEQQACVKFTQCKMEYNMGWLVQAEAPPAALFRKFRKVVISGQANALDVAFYFLHWFTDLAGAEPCPTEGCEKLVLKFPQKVLDQFLSSFSIVQNLSPTKSETQVFEEYLVWRWNELDAPVGPAPAGKGSIAKMRLVVMAQGDSAEILRQFKKLNEEDQFVLSEELALTGSQGQVYARNTLKDSFMRGKGPAILVYYAPALMQKGGKTDPYGALMVLAEVFRQARALWPLSEAEVNDTVSIRIDTLKELEVAAIAQPEAGDMWVLTRTSSMDGAVQRISVATVDEVNWSTHRILTIRQRLATRRDSFDAAERSSHSRDRGPAFSERGTTR